MMHKCPLLEMSTEQVHLAFSHAKELHIKEMEDIDRYTRLTFCEFLEFIARAGVLLYADH